MRSIFISLEIEMHTDRSSNSRKPETFDNSQSELASPSAKPKKDKKKKKRRR